MARFALPLLACAWSSFVYLLHQWKVIACMVHLNNKLTMVQRPSNRLTVTNVVSDWTSLTINYLLPPFSQSACQKKLFNSLAFLTSNDGKGGGLERIVSLHYTYTCKSGSQIELLSFPILKKRKLGVLNAGMLLLLCYSWNSRAFRYKVLLIILSQSF